MILQEQGGQEIHSMILWDFDSPMMLRCSIDNRQGGCTTECALNEIFIFYAIKYLIESINCNCAHLL